MATPTVHDFLRRQAPQDVRDTVRWLEEHGYQLTSSPTEAQSSFGALLVLTGDVDVEIVCDRSQWFLAVAPTPGGERLQYDLLVAASRGDDYWDCFPGAADVSRFPMPEQLPVGVSWRSTLPAVLDWIRSPGVAEAVQHANDQRYAVMWPDSHKAKQLRRTWRRQAEQADEQAG